MIIVVKPHEIFLKKEEEINEKEVNISKCIFDFDKEITDEFVKEAIFTIDDKSFIKIINNNECDYPPEILDSYGTCIIGVVASLIRDNKIIKRFNPYPKKFAIIKGSLRKADNSQPITPSEFEQYMQALQTELNKLNSKVEEATTQGNFAKEQGDYAKAQADNAKNVTDDLIEKEKNGELNGATFIPNVDFSGNLSWTNDKNLDNPETVNITGPQGPKGDCNFATFDIDIETGNLVMTKPDDMSQIDFGLNEKIGNLEVIVNV